MVMPKDPEKAEATRKRMSESAKKRIRTPEQEEARKQAARSPEAIARLSATQKARLANPEVRRAMSEATKRSLADPEVRQRRNEAATEGLNRPEVKARRSVQMKKVWEETDIRERVSEAVKAAMVEVNARPEFHEHLSEAMQRVWANPEQKEKRLIVFEKLRATSAFREAVASGIAAKQKSSGTNIEIIVEAFLRALEVEYEAQKHIGWWIVDFYVPGKNLIIECDGDYWHGKPEVQARDVRKDAYFARKGYQVLRLLGSQIMSGDLKSLVEILVVG